MKCLTVREPHATNIILGRKRIEYRTWGKNVRGRIGIHRGGKNGAIIGTVEVVDVVARNDAYEWVLKDPIAFSSPISCRGRLSLWEYSL